MFILSRSQQNRTDRKFNDTENKFSKNQLSSSQAHILVAKD